MSHAEASCRVSTHPIVLRELGTIDYLSAWELQRQLVADRANDTGSDTLLLLEHPSVYTAGKRTTPEERPQDGTPVIDVDRGGKITWHGPGQIVGYPILELADPIDVVDYVRRLEQALIWVCDQFDVTAGRVDGRSGVWLPEGGGEPERKIAAIGIRVQQGVTMHGIELNCNAELTAFERIVPCGISDAGVTSLSRELGRQVPVAEALPLVRRAICDAVDGSLPVTERDIPRRTDSPTTPGVTWGLDAALR